MKVTTTPATDLAFTNFAYCSPSDHSFLRRILLVLELEFVKKGAQSEEVDALLLSIQLRKKFINQVLTVGQRATFEYHGTNYILTVNQAVAEGQEQSNGIKRGMICEDACFVFEASNAIQSILLILQPRGKAGWVMMM
ncbi:unnamed protein product [Arabis nemorensis]|uniref:Vesicle-fusing ATPase n=1 Tax=Arabis nemorensis TaxID=586526 RepID=A0A565B1S3_9BRAS|nr:unnamed protein product [Arabis nemorensis]